MRDFLERAVKVAVLAALAGGTFGIVLAWTGPSTTPPNGNTAAPINVSSTAQTKAGAFTASNLCTSAGICLSNNVISGGMWEVYSIGGCLVPNAFTNACSCPAYAPNAYEGGFGNSNNNNYAYVQYYCI